ncbi:MAG: ABC transporter ATP-binding protein [Kiritimatiellia bacterium]
MSPIQHATNLLRVVLQPRKRLLAATIVAVLLLNILELATPKILQLFIDALSGTPMRIWGLPLPDRLAAGYALLLLPAALLTFAAARWITAYIRAVYESRLGQGALFDLRCRIFDTMQRLSFAYHDSAHSGTLISNVVEDVNYTTMFMQQGLMLILESCAFVLISYIFIFAICWQAGLVSLLLFSGGGGLIALGARYGYPLFARTKALFAATVELFSESVEGSLVVKAFGAGPALRERYAQRVDRLHDSEWRERFLGSAINQSLQWTSYLGIPAVIGAALWAAQSANWNLTTGRLFLLFYLQSGIRMRTWRIGRAIETTIRFTVTAERIGRLLEADAYLEDHGTTPLPPDGPGLEVQDVSFSYGNREHSVRHVSLGIPTGSTIGVVGKTGVGKSTLALLLCRFYDPDSGSVWLHGHDIRDYPLRELRHCFAFVFQDTFLFSASIRDNIAYGKPDARFEEIVHAATIACIHDFIMEQPEGYETIIGERGVTLSGGQRQRISIARAILQRPRFLILDACTSALDAATERAVQAGLRTLQPGTTSIIIAHRMSSIEHADHVYVMDAGTIVESGSPNELSREGSQFKRILQL